MASNRHESRFSYNLSKPYPFRWFTPVAITGLIVSAALFSFLNYVTSGFYLINTNSSNPNETTHGTGWMTHLPSYFRSNSAANCQPVTIPVGSMLFTNQTALTYTLTSVWSTTTASGNDKTFYPSLPYYNNILQHCDIWGVEVDISNYETLQPNQIAFSGIGVVVTTFITCSIHGPKGLQFFNLSQAYDYVPQSVPMAGINTFLATNFISRNKEKSAPLWWGETLLSMYWDFLTFDLRTIADTLESENTTTIVKGGLWYTLRHPPNEGDLADLDFFIVDYRYSVMPYANWVTPPTIFPGLFEGQGNYSKWQSTALLNATAQYPDVWAICDLLAKSAWSTVLVDLGQAHVKPNVLTNGTLLAQWTAEMGAISVGGDVINPIPGPATRPYMDPGYDGYNGPLLITPSVISAEYLCQVPKRKPIGNLIITVLVADLVLLQGVWWLYKLVVDTFCLKEKDSSLDLTSESRTSFLGSASPARGGFSRIAQSPGWEEELQPIPLVRYG